MAGRRPIDELQHGMPSLMNALDQTLDSDKTAPRQGVRVLLVDDNADALETMQALLELCNFEVRGTGNPQEALAIAPEFAPQVCVLDIGLPGMDGYELASRLRKTVKTPSRFVALTGYGQACDKERAKSAGFDVHLTKPVQLDALLEAARLP